MAINNPVIADADIIQDTAVAIQEKDHGGKMEFPDIPSRIRALPTNLIPKTITQNGVYNASSDNADGYDVVTVDVPQDPNKSLDDYIQGDLTDIVFNGTVVTIGIFRGTTITSISMPNVITIEEYAFAQTPNLQKIDMPDSVLSLGFYSCYESNISFVHFSKNIRTFPQSSFQNCSNLVSIKLPQKLLSCSGSTFANCTGLQTVDVSEVESATPITITTTTFLNTTCTFLFRDQTQLDEYANATNWSALASRFQIKPNGVI